jgi:hypothetical protein
VLVDVAFAENEQCEGSTMTTKPIFNATEPGAAWSASARVKKDGNGLVQCAQNLELLLEKHPDVKLWYDTRADCAVWTLCPWGESPRPVHLDEDAIDARIWVEKQTGWQKMPVDPMQVVLSVARKCKRDPWKRYLKKLKWDRKRRLKHAARDLFGDQSDAAQSCFRWWMRSAVARTFRPGCQADYVLILESKQGQRKTSFFNTLVGEEYYARITAQSYALDHPRNIALLQSAVVAELSEMAAVKKADQDLLKTFIDMRIDKWTPLHAKQKLESKRRCIFAGTTNKSEYLLDVTGARRFWPITVTKIVSTKTLSKLRDQLWAEAVADFNAGKHWWPTKKEETKLGLQELQASRTEVADPALPEKLARKIADAKPGPIFGSRIHDNTATSTRLHNDQFEANKLVWITMAQASTMLDNLTGYRVRELFNVLGIVKKGSDKERLPWGAQGQKWKVPDSLIGDNADLSDGISESKKSIPPPSKAASKAYN